MHELVVVPSLNHGVLFQKSYWNVLFSKGLSSLGRENCITHLLRKLQYFTCTELLLLHTYTVGFYAGQAQRSKQGI